MRIVQYSCFLPLAGGVSLRSTQRCLPVVPTERRHEGRYRGFVSGNRLSDGRTSVSTQRRAGPVASVPRPTLRPTWRRAMVPAVRSSMAPGAELRPGRERLSPRRQEGGPCLPCSDGGSRTDRQVASVHVEAWGILDGQHRRTRDRTGIPGQLHADQVHLPRQGAREVPDPTEQSGDGLAREAGGRGSRSMAGEA